MTSGTFFIGFGNILSLSLEAVSYNLNKPRYVYNGRFHGILRIVMIIKGCMKKKKGRISGYCEGKKDSCRHFLITDRWTPM